MHPIQALLCGLKGQDHGLGTAHQGALLAGHPQGGFDLGHQRFIPREVDRPDQLFHLRALQRDLRQAGFQQGGTGGGIAGQFLGLLGRHAGFHHLGLAVLLAAHQLFFQGAGALVGLPAEPGHAQGAQQHQTHGRLDP